MKIIYTTIVGSKMHGLETPDSDEDIRHITLHSLQEVISPFKNDTTKVGSSENDVESWELRHFCKHLTAGNPTTYEVIKSPLYTKNEFAEEFRFRMPLFFDSYRILMAHCGYADAQLKRYLNKLNKLTPKEWETVEENVLRRVPKSIVAAYRVIEQGKQLIDHGDFCTNIKDYSLDLWEQLMAIKLMNPKDINSEICEYHKAKIEDKIKDLKIWYDARNKPPVLPKIDKIEKFLLETYLKYD